MDPQIFIRLSIDSLGLRIPRTTKPAATKSGIRIIYSPCSCEIRLRGFPVQTTSVPYVSVSEAIHQPNPSSSFYLEESDIKALRAPSCFYGPQVGFLEIIVFASRKGSHCGVGIKRQHIGTFRLEVGQGWCIGKPMILFNGWVGIGKNNGNTDAELHLRVRLDPDPRFVFQFEDETKLSPQVVQLQGSIKQPIFSCQFTRDRVSKGGPLSNYSNKDSKKRERKGWKVQIHDLSGSAVAAAYITTPFVPSPGCNWVSKSNPGGWVIVRPGGRHPDTWEPWGKLEAWRERGTTRDSVCCRFHLFSEITNRGEGGKEVLMSEVFIDTDKGGEFFIDTDRHVRAQPTPNISKLAAALESGGFVMNCRVRGEGKSSKPMVQMAMRHITCVEDAAIFIALAAAVDLSIEACRPFRRNLKIGRGNRHSWDLMITSKLKKKWEVERTTRKDFSQILLDSPWDNTGLLTVHTLTMDIHHKDILHLVDILLRVVVIHLQNILLQFMGTLPVTHHLHIFHLPDILHQVVTNQQLIQDHHLIII